MIMYRDEQFWAWACLAYPIFKEAPEATGFQLVGALDSPKSSRATTAEFARDKHEYGLSLIWSF